MLIVMKTGYIEKLPGGGTRTFRKGAQYRVPDELGKQLCDDGTANAVEQPASEAVVDEPTEPTRAKRKSRRKTTRR